MSCSGSEFSSDSLDSFNESESDDELINNSGFDGDVDTDISTDISIDSHSMDISDNIILQNILAIQNEDDINLNEFDNASNIYQSLIQQNNVNSLQLVSNERRNIRRRLLDNVYNHVNNIPQESIPGINVEILNNNLHDDLNEFADMSDSDDSCTSPELDNLMDREVLEIQYDTSNNHIQYDTSNNHIQYDTSNNHIQYDTSNNELNQHVYDCIDLLIQNSTHLHEQMFNRFDYIFRSLQSMYENRPMIYLLNQMNLYYIQNHSGLQLVEFRNFYSQNLSAVIEEDARNYGMIQTDDDGNELNNTFGYMNEYDGRNLLLNITNFFNNEITNLFGQEVVSLADNIGTTPGITLYMILRGAFPRHTEIQTLSDIELNNIVIQDYSTITNEHQEKYSSCVVCSDTFTNDHKVKQLQCEHIFHVECIDTWLRTYSAQCPLCKQNVLT